MRHLVAGLILMASSYTTILAQQKHETNLTPPISNQPSMLVSSNPTNTELSQPLASQISFRQSQDQSIQPPNLVVRNGAVYLRMGTGFLIGIPGGGASGCFSLDLPRRIATLDEFTRRLDSLKQGEQQPN